MEHTTIAHFFVKCQDKKTEAKLLRLVCESGGRLVGLELDDRPFLGNIAVVVSLDQGVAARV